MKALLLAATLLAGCGYSSTNSELIGQVKKVTHQTPIFCSEWDAVDISLGVLRNGVGSMSTQDVWITVRDKRDLDVLKAANESGALVKVEYDEYRLKWCIEEKVLRRVEVLKP